MEKIQQDFQPIIVGRVTDLVVRRNISTRDGLYAQQTSFHINIVANATELPQ